MTIEQNKPETPESQLKNMQTVNELLLVRNHQLEGELDHHSKRNQELEKMQSAKSGSGQGICWVDDELPEALAEIQRLHAQVEVLRKTHQLEAENALNVKLGNILIQSVDSPGNLISVPGKVGKIWRESSRKNPPKALGGKNFGKVIAAYNDGGFKAVEKLFAGIFLAPAMQANAYTALARHLMKSDRTAVAEAARRAYEIDPQPFRMKWLAFRLHKAGNVIEAEAMLDILSKNITFSESESRQVNQLRSEAKYVRQHEAKQKTGFAERRAEVERQLELIKELPKAIAEEEKQNELLTHQLFKTQEELESQHAKYQTLEQAKKQLEADKAALVGEKDEQSKLATDLQSQVEQLIKDKTEVEEKYVGEIDILKQTQTRLEADKAALVGEKEEQTKLATDLQSQIEQLIKDKTEVEEKYVGEIDILKQTQTRLEADKAALVGEKDEQSKLATDLQSQIEQLIKDKTEVEEKYVGEIDILKQTQTRLEADKAALVGEKDEQSKLATDLQSQIEQLIKDKTEVEEKYVGEIDILKQTQTRLEADKAALVGEKEEQTKLATDLQSQVEQLIKDKTEVEEKYVGEIDILKQTQTRLEEEKAEVVREKDEQGKLAADLQSQVEQLTHNKTEVEEKFVREIEALRQAQTKLAEEKAAVVGEKDEQAKLATERHKQIDELQQQVKTKQASEAELLMRQNMMQEEMVRAEAQLDLIKDMLLREQGV